MLISVSFLTLINMGQAEPNRRLSAQVAKPVKISRSSAP